MNTKHARISLAAAALTLPAALMAGNLTALILKSSNSDNVDITAGLAYLRPILVVSFTTFGLLCLISLIFGIIGLRKGDRSLSKFSLVLLVTILVVSLAAGLLQKQTDQLERDYSEKQFNGLVEDLQTKFEPKKQ